MTHERAPLRTCRERRLGGDPVLLVAEIVGGRRQQLEQHHAQIRLVALDPVRVGAHRIVRERLAEAAEVLGEIIDLRVAARQRAGFRGRGAVEAGRALGLEREGHARVVRVQRARRDRQLVGGEVPGVPRRQLQERPAVLVERPIAGGHRLDGNGRDRLAPADRDLLRCRQRSRQRDGVEEVDEGMGLVLAADLDEVDPVARRAREEEGEAVHAQCTWTDTWAGVWVSTAR